MKKLTEMQRKLVNALRSGDYRQGRGALRTHDGYYCCLGVAACVADAQWIEDHNTFYLIGIDYECHQRTSSSLPEDIASEFGIDQELQDDMIVWNDNEDKDFFEIARIIEGIWNGTILRSDYWHDEPIEEEE